MVQNRRPLVIGVAASATCCALLVLITVLGAGHNFISPWMVAVIAFAVAGSVSAVVGVPVAIWLRKQGKLSFLPLCIAGTLAGAVLLGTINGWSNYWPQMLDQTHAVTTALRSAGRTAVSGALIGMLSSVAFCFGAGVPLRRS